MNNLKKIYTTSKNISEYSIKYVDYLTDLLGKINFEELKIFEKEFLKIRKNNNSIYVAGNGGGASTSSAIANDIGFDLLKKTKKKGFKLISMTENSSIISAIANDVGFENIFLRQLQNNFKKGDGLLIFSASGNSKNLILAAKFVKSHKGKVFSVVGFNGGKIKKLSDVCIHVKTLVGEYGPVEDIQLIFNHILAHWFQNKL